MLSFRPEPAFDLQGWSWVRIGASAKEIRERAGAGSGCPVLSVSKHRGVLPASEYFKKPVHGKDLSGYKVVRRGQLAYATIHLDEGSAGILRDFEAGLVSPMYTVFEVSGEVDAEYLLAVLKAPSSGAIFRALGQGSVNRRASIPFAALSELYIHIPSVDVQREIVAILAAVQNVIEKTQLVIRFLASAKNGLVGNLLARGLPNRHVRFKALGEEWHLGRLGEVREIPESWDLVKITSVARLESGHTPSRKKAEYWGGDIHWVSLHDSKDLGAPEIFETAQKISRLGLANSSARILPKGTVVFSRTASVGKATILGREMATSQDFANYVCGVRLHNRYLMHFLRHNQAEWGRLMSGSTHKTIYMPVFRNLQILLPPYEEQVEIADFVDRLDARLASEQKLVNSLTRLKAALSAALLTGQIAITLDETRS